MRGELIALWVSQAVGVGPHNSPTLQMPIMATIEGFGLNWAMWTDQLLLVSVGTGAQEIHMYMKELMNMSTAKVLFQALTSLMNDCDDMNRTILQLISQSQRVCMIDRETGVYATT